MNEINKTDVLAENKGSGCIASFGILGGIAGLLFAAAILLYQFFLKIM